MMIFQALSGIKLYFRMPFAEQLRQVAIAEWRECYINYSFLKNFIIVIREIVQAKEECHSLLQVIDESEGEEGAPIFREEVLDIERNLEIRLQTANCLFFFIYGKEAKIAGLFYQMKVMQIESKFERCLHFKDLPMTDQDQQLLLNYIEFVYIEVRYLSEMRETNQKASEAILEKHKESTQKLADTPPADFDKIARMSRIETEYIKRIENLYADINKSADRRESREYLKNLVQKEETGCLGYVMIGAGLGASLLVLAVLVFIILYSGLNIENNSVFARDFPAWRGVAIFIIYIWVLGVNLWCFERYKISHRLILEFKDHHRSTSGYVFGLAGVFTVLYMLTFFIYLMQINDVINSGSVFLPQHLVLIPWLALVGYLLMPLPIFNYQNRLYILKIFLQSFITPITGVPFVTLMMVEQWISLTTPLRDTVYTACYFARLDLTQSPAADGPDDVCTVMSRQQVVLAIILIPLGYRILQCIRDGVSQGEYFCTTNFGNTVKFIIIMVPAILAYYYELGHKHVFGWWLGASVVMTSYAYYWDLKYDWALLDWNEDHKACLLRKYLTFEPARNYYIIMIVNLVFRLSWLLTLSPGIVEALGNDNLFTFLTGSIQIIRRGVWNLLIMETFHLTNCKNFQAIPDISHIEKQLENSGSHSEANGHDIALSSDELRSKHEREEALREQFVRLIKREVARKDCCEGECYEEYEQAKREEVKLLRKKIGELRERLRPGQ